MSQSTAAVAADLNLKCPLCGGTAFSQFKTRALEQCIKCRSKGRTRLMYSLVERCGLLRSDIDVLHFAPERSLAVRFLELLGSRYLAADLDEGRLSRSLPKEARRIQVDLCRIDPELAARKFDLILHSHVMEHLPCSWTIVLLRLQRMLKPGGYQVFSIPMIAGYSREDVSPELSPEKRLEMFGQEDHMRWVGRETFSLDIENIKVLTGASFIEAESFFSQAEFAAMSGRGHVFALRAPGVD